MFDYKGKVVFITGGSAGIGKQMAQGFAEAGADLVISARREEVLAEAKKDLEQYGGRVLAVQCDVTNVEQIEAAVQKAIDEFGKIDVLVNNAGGNKPGSVLDYDDQAWDFTIETDLSSVMRMTRPVAKHMVEAGYGRIINIASMYGILGTNQNASAYHAAKAGVINYTRAAAAELGEKGVTVNAICPGFFTTELTVDTLETDDFKAYMNISVPLNRPGKEGELNSGALFLGAEESSYVNGAILPIDGGWSAVK